MNQSERVRKGVAGGAAWPAWLRSRTVGAELSGLLVAGAALVWLVVRLEPDVGSKPIHGDEALAGLVSLQPTGDLVRTVVVERGGAPLHFLLAHVALTVDPAWQSLRWLSVVLAVATVAATYDLGRRLAGPVCGATAAVVASTSTLLGIYGSFGRMYSLFALAGALAASSFVRALRRPTTRTVALAAAAAWLLAAAHPYGGVVAGGEAVIGLVLWRGRGLRIALPAAVAALLALPFVYADVRLAHRFDAGVNPGNGVLRPHELWAFVRGALEAFAGGRGLFFVAFAALGLAGLVLAARALPAYAAFAVLAFVAPIAVLTLAHVSAPPVTSTRHVIVALPVAASLVGIAVGRLTRGSTAAAVFVLVVVAALAIVSPSGGAQDPRLADPEAAPTVLAGPSDWVRGSVTANDVLFPYSPVFFAAARQVRRATVLASRGGASTIRAGLSRVHPPVAAVFVAIPIGGATVDEAVLRRRLAGVGAGRVFGPWVVVQMAGPYPSDLATVSAALRGLKAADAATRRQGVQARHYYRVMAATLCHAIPRSPACASR